MGDRAFPAGGLRRVLTGQVGLEACKGPTNCIECNHDIGFLKGLNIVRELKN